jgi:preprotein translocase subunit SecB
MAEEQTGSLRQVLIENLYLKDLSFASSNTPDAFAASVNAENLLNIRSANSKIDPARVEVTLTVSVKAVAREIEIYRVEVVQGGVFSITGYRPEERVEILGRVCPETLFPFARTLIIDMITKGGFPEVLLNPIDFDELFAKNMRERAARTATT